MATQLNLPLPSKLNLSSTNLAIVWRNIYAKFINYEIATDLATASAKRRIAVFLACAGAEGQDLFDTFDLSDEDREDFDAVIVKFKDHCSNRCVLQQSTKKLPVSDCTALHLAI